MRAFAVFRMVGCVMCAWGRRRREERLRLRAAEHDRLRLVCAVDWAITVARRTAAPGDLVVVTVEAVQARAFDDFALTVTRAQAAAALREKLRLRAGFDIAIDLDDPDDDA